MEEENKAIFLEVAKINRANRFFKTAFLCSMGLNIAALGSIVVMLPLKQKEIFVYGIDKNKGGYEIVKLSNASNILNSEAIINRELKRFVSLLFGYSPNTQMDRLSQLKQFSSDSFKTKAVKMFKENNALFKEDVRAEAFISSTIERARLENSPLTQLTFFITIKISPETMEKYEFSLRKQVILYCDYAKNDHLDPDLTINPLGFKVYNVEVIDLENEQTISEILKKIKDVQSKNKNKPY